MLKVLLTLAPVSDDDKKAQASIAIEGRRNEMWTREKLDDVMPGQANVVRTIILEDHQRLVIEQPAKQGFVYDPDQRANVGTGEPPEHALEPKPGTTTPAGPPKVEPQPQPAPVAPPTPQPAPQPSPQPSAPKT